MKKDRPRGLPDMGLKLAIKAAGNKHRLSKLLDITPQALQFWSRIPEDRIVQVEHVTGVDRSKLRPDLYAFTPRRHK